MKQVYCRTRDLPQWAINKLTKNAPKEVRLQGEIFGRRDVLITGDLSDYCCLWSIDGGEISPSDLG